MQHRVSGIHSGKNDLHIRIPAGAGWDKHGGENSLDSRAFGGLWEMWIPAVSLQTEC